MNESSENARIRAGVTRGREVTISVDGEPVRAYEGETIGGALTASGLRAIRRSPHRRDPRGLYCGMGLCHECLVTVDGQANERACMTPVRAGQVVELQNGFGHVNTDPFEPAPSSPQRHQAPLVVVGAGPAGLSAAIAAADLGVDVLVIDENLQAGGQIYRRMSREFQTGDTKPLGADYAAGGALLDQVRAMSDRITIWNEARLWSVFEQRTLAVERDERLFLIEAEAVVVATGAYDRPVAVPGWTLPGVMTCGGAQVLVKSQRVRPGRRVLVAGTGPLLLVVANQLLDADVDVVAVAETAGLARVWGNAFGLLQQPALVRRGLKYMRSLRRASVPLMRRYTLASIDGTDQVQRATLVRVDHQQRPIAGQTKSFDVDTVLMGYGFLPNTAVARMLGCSHVYDRLSGSWSPRFDAQMRTDQESVYVAGDCAGVAGVLVARQQGALAGLFAACQITGSSSKRAERLAGPIRRRLDRLSGFRAAMERMYPTGSGLYTHMDDATVICRCEEVTAGQIRGAMGEGTADLNDVKKRTRSGMGYCQGANCNPCMAAMLEREFDVDPRSIVTLTGRPPIKPTGLAALNFEMTE